MSDSTEYNDPSINDEYDDESDIDFNEGLTALRVDPGVYLDSTDVKAIMHIYYEVFDNSIDVSKVEGSKLIKIRAKLNRDGSACITDNAGGIPVRMNNKKKMRMCFIAFEKMHGGSKLRNKKKKTKTVGTHGLGLSALTACSKWVKVTIKQDGKAYFFSYTEAKRDQLDIELVGECTAEEEGTTIEFMPDYSILKLEHPTLGRVEYPYIVDEIKEKMQNYMLFNSNIEIHFEYDTPNQGSSAINYTKDKYSQASILSAYTTYPTINDKFHRDARDLDVDLKIAISEGETIQRTGVNGLFLEKGGHHEEALKKSICSYVYEVFKQSSILEEGFELYDTDVICNISYIQSVSVLDPQFSGQVKNYLSDTDIGNCLAEHYAQAVPKFSSAFLKSLIKLVTDQYKTRVEQSKALKSKREKRSKKFTPKERLMWVTTVQDCRSTDKKMTRMYFVEGGTAGIAISNERDPEFIGVCEMQGKLINALQRKDRKYIDANGKIKDKLRDDEQFKKLDAVFRNPKYGKFVLSTDADVDGKHIRTLWISLIVQEYPELIEQGKVFIVIPPLFRFTYTDRSDKQKEVYFEDAKLKDEFFEEHPELSNAEGSDLHENKGLGEMRPDEIYDSLVRKPNLIKVTFSSVKDIEDELEFVSEIMGVNTKYRRKIMMENFAGPKLQAYARNYKEKVYDTRCYVDPLNASMYLAVDGVEEGIDEMTSECSVED